jgi:glyoxylase-like metal-dependent hydrolase (beta-lactamase superfamily II)
MSANFLRIEMGKALHGDCLFVEWSGANGKHRMLIDGGPIGAYDALAARIDALGADDREFELIVLSHVDTDHIEGMVRLFAEPAAQWPFRVKDVWFNGWRHMDDEMLGGRQGEFFSALLQHRLPPGAWNRAFGGAVVVPQGAALPVVPLAGGMNLTLLSPTRPKLDKMREAWRKDLRRTPITPGDIDAAWQELGEQKKYLPDEGL